MKLLIIEDDEQMCRFFSNLAIHLGHQSSYVHTLDDGLASSKLENYDLVILDLELPDGNGLSILPDILNLPSSPEVIIITGTGDIHGAALAYKHGVWDYISKPANPDKIILSISRATKYRNERQQAKKPKFFSRKGIIGDSPVLKLCLKQIAQVAPTEINVLINGETGTGKELIARAIHNNSMRANGSFVVVDCTTLPDSLIESTLFGHEKGSFTGASDKRVGLIKQAEKGTLFIDEVGELTLSMQKKFLRVLQERRFRTVGGDTEIQSDFRLVAATNCNLESMVEKGDFRKDLLYRLQSIIIKVPPLRTRQEDIRLLVMNRLEKNNTTNCLAPKSCSKEFIQMLQEYNWPGNIRELLSTVDRAQAIAGEINQLLPIHLPPQIRTISFGLNGSTNIKTEPALQENHDVKDLSGMIGEIPTFRNFRESQLDKIERKYLKMLIKKANGNYSEAYRISALARTRLYELLKKHGLSITSKNK